MAQENDWWKTGATAADAAKPADEWWKQGVTPVDPKRSLTDYARDVAATAVKGAIAVPEAIVGLADIPTGGRVGKFLENDGGSVGFRPKEAKELVNDWHSDATKEAQRKFQAADGIVDKTVTALQNPSLIATAVGESLPSMGLGGVAARGLMTATKLGQMGAKGARLASGAGEGLVMGGSAAEQIRQETPDGLLTPGQSALAAATAVVGGGFGVLGGKVASRLGVGDVDTMIAQGSKGMADEAGAAAARAASNPLVHQQAMKGIPRRVVEGAIAEGFLEELPQSIAEQVFQNLALGKDWLQDVDAAAVMGVLSGGVMGGGAAGYHGFRQPAQRDDGHQPAPTPEQGGQPDPQAPTAPSTGMQRIQQAFADQLAALQAQEQGEVLGPQSVPPDGAAVLAQQQAEEAARRQAAQEASRSVASPDDEIYQSTGATVPPSVHMGLDPAAGPLSAGAAIAVDAGVSGQMQHAAALAKASEQAAKNGKKQAEPTQKQEQTTQALQGVDPETGEIQQGAMAGWSDAQLSDAFRGAQSRDVRMQLAGELSRRRAEREQQALQAELYAEQAGTVPGAEGADAAFASLSEDAGPVPADLSIPTTIKGNTDVPQADQAEQAAAQPAQAGPAQPAQGLTDAAPAEYPGAQGTPATGAQAAPEAETREQRSQRVASAGDAWTRMPTVERQALAQRADLKPIVQKNVHQAQWADLNGGVQRKIANAMAPAAGLVPQVEAGPQEAIAEQGVNLTGTSMEQASVATKMEAPTSAAVQGSVAAVPTAKKPRGVLSKKAEAEAKARADYFTPGNIVKSYGGHDRVVSYIPPGEDGRWSVTVRAVEKLGGAWVDVPREIDRVHWTQPDARELKAGPVARGSAIANLANPKSRVEPGEQDAATSPNLRMADERAPGAADPAQDGTGQPDAGAAPAGGAEQRAGGDTAKPAPTVRAAVPDAGSASEPPAAVAKPEAEAEQRPAAKQNITDFGEKIGGARKDTAAPTGQKAGRARNADERPAWARRFEVSQIVKSSRPGEEGRWSVHDARSKDSLGQPRRVGERSYASEDDALQAIPLIAVAQKHRVVPVREGDGTGWEIWRDVTERKRVKVVDQVFATREAALEHMAKNAQQIIETNTTFGEADLPRPDSDQRIGAARRDGDARDSDFTQVFGFRGVEFGNWNNQKERQDLLNDAYDGLLDLAEVMGIPPRAISLNGELALAFGARGKGLSGARAHYELDKAVINLTKMNGAGSLAHEWFHALDHYFGRQDGKAPAEWVVAKDGTRSFAVHLAAEDSMASGGTRGERSGMRAEVREAYAELMRTISRKAEGYLADTEQADRFVAAARKDVERRLKGMRDELARSLDERYYKRHNKPASAEQLAEFDSVAEKIVAGELLELRVESKAGARAVTSGVRWTNDALNKLSAVMKAVRGRQGFNADGDGPLDRLRGDMQFYSSRLKMLADAQSGAEKTRMVPTRFVMDAKELDQGRGQDYWTKPHELAARAFQGYVEDKIAEQGGKSPFLNHGPENAGIATPWGWKRPFPAGVERKAINAAFDNLADVIQTREGEGGNLVLFSRSTESVPQSAAEWLPDTVIADEVEKRIGGFAQQPPIRIRDTAFGQLPGVARNDNVAGAVHDGAIYLFRDQLGDRAAVQRTLFHELFHFGLRKFLTKEQFTGQMMDLYRRDKAIKDEADRWAATADGLRAKELGGSEYALARGVDEALAILAEPNGGPHLNQTARAMFVRRVTNWLADVAQFLKMDKAAAYLRSLHNSEARAYIQSVFKRLESDAGRVGADWSESGGPAFSRASTADMPADGSAAGAGFNVDGFLSTMARSAAVTRAAGVTDRAVMDMVREGKPARDILRLVAGTSKSRFNRQVARLLLKSGITPTVQLEPGDLGSDGGFKFLGKYSRKFDTVTMTPGAELQAEHIVMHELMHAATLRALDRKGLASLQMRRLYEHVKRQGGAAGEYGMKNVGEFVAEAFTNPEFQRALRGITAPPGGTLKSAWDSFVRILRSILGLSQDAHDALSQALELGVAVMREDMRLRTRSEIARGRDAYAGVGQTQTPNFLRWYGDWQNAGHVPQQMEPDRGGAQASRDGGSAPIDGVQRPAGVGQDAARANRARRFTFSGASGPTGADGAPVRLYHGTKDDIAAFDLSHPRRKDNGWLGDGVYLTSNLDDANQYARAKRGAAGPNLMPLYANVRNPYEASQADKARLKHASKQAITAFTEALKAKGHDGVVLWDEDGDMELVAFQPAQVKSAIGNNGNFDPEDDDIAHFGMAEATEAARNIGNGIRGITAASIKKAGKHKLTDWLSLGLQFLGRRQLVEVYGDMLPMAEYDRLAAQMEADKNDVGATADDLARRWGKLPDEGKLADLMHDATLAQIDADSATDYVDGDDKFKSTMLKRQFSALTPEAQKVYREARDSYREHHAQVRQAIRDRIMRSELSESKRAELLRKMDDDFFQKVKGVYFPLARFGQYAVAVKGQDGAVVSVSRAETMPEAENLREEMRKAFPASQGYAVGRVTLSKDFVANHQMVGRGFVADLYAALEKMDVPHDQLAELEDTIGQLYLSSLPDLSWAKHGIHRKGTPGFSQDARRAFAQNTFHGARYLAKLRYGDLMQSELDSMQKHVDDWRDADDFDQPKAQRVVNEMMKRHDLLMNPVSNPLSTALTSAGFVYYLGLSPAAAMVNLSQTALVAYPVMAGKWGYKKSAEALMKASAEAVAGKNDIRTQLKDADEIAAYDAAVKAGTIDVTQSHDLAGIAQGEDAKVMWKMRPVMRRASYLFHHAERFNRQATFIAAYRLAREAGAQHESAYEQATKATYDGHYDYSSGNRPRVMQGNVARVVLLFKQFAQNMIFTLARNAYQSVAGESPAVRKEARKVFAGLITMHAAAAGVLGLPLVGPLLAVASALGGDDDEPWDAEVALRNMLADAFGDKAAEVIARGFSRLTPWDISGRVGLDKLIFPDVQEGLEGQRWAEQFATGMLGPVIGMGVNAARGAQKMADGDYVRALEDFLPVFARNQIKSGRYFFEGEKSRKGGEVIKDEVSFAGVAGQFVGFSPSEVRLAFEGKKAVIDEDRRLFERRKELLAKISKATMAKDDEAKAEAREEIKRFNEKNPGRRINPNHIMQSVHNRKNRIDQAQDGVYLPKSRRDAMQAGRFAFAESE